MHKETRNRGWFTVTGLFLQNPGSILFPSPPPTLPSAGFSSCPWQQSPWIGTFWISRHMVFVLSCFGAVFLKFTHVGTIHIFRVLKVTLQFWLLYLLTCLSLPLPLKNNKQESNLSNLFTFPPWPGTYWVAHTGLKLTILLPQLPTCWYYRNMPPELKGNKVQLNNILDNSFDAHNLLQTAKGFCSIQLQNLSIR